MFNKDRVGSEASQVRDELAHMRDDLDQLMGTVRRLAATTAAGMRDTAEDAASAAQEEAERLYDLAQAQGRQAAQRIGNTVRENPLMSAGIALGLGLLAGWLITRRF